MKSETRNLKLLGFAFLLQFITSFSAGVILSSQIISPGNVSFTLQRVTENEILFKGALFLDGVTALGVIFLGAVLYLTVKRKNNFLALTAFGLYLLEAVTHIFDTIFSYSLWETGSLFFSTGEPEYLLAAAQRTLSIMDYSGSLMMLAFCPGAAIFYLLIMKSKIVPRPLTLWGIISVSFLLLWTILSIFGINVPFALYFPYVPFELVIGIWLIMKKG